MTDKRGCTTPVRHPASRCAVPTLVILALAACGPEPLQFADWIIEVPDGTPVHEYAPVPMGARDADAIRLTEEMVIGADLGNPDTGVFRPTLVVGTREGTVFVADFATKRVQMYDRNGRYLKTLGKEGQGPGEFASLTSMTIAGDLLVIDDARNDRLSTWTLDGVHAGDHRKPPGVAARSRGMQGLADGTLIVRSSTDWVSDRRKQTVSRVSLEGEELGHLDEMVPAPGVFPERSWTPREFGQALIGLFDDPIRDFAVGVGHVYVTPVQQYQVLSFSSDGTPRWALRVAGPRAPISSGTRRAVLRQATGGEGGLSEDELEWPAEFPALADILTDSNGRLYVVPNVSYQGTPPSQVPTDVYSADGQRVAAGYLPARWGETFASFVAPWSYAVGDHVYGLREDESGETVAVRYRLVLTER